MDTLSTYDNNQLSTYEDQCFHYRNQSMYKSVVQINRSGFHMLETFILFRLKPIVPNNIDNFGSFHKKDCS